MAATGLVCHLLLYSVENADSTGSSLSDYLDFLEYGKKTLWFCK